MAAATYADFSLDGPEIGTLVIVVDRAKNLPNRKTTKQDPYCQARLGKICNKTKTDRRGGQTPRWDEELRFKVLDAPDYYTLKLSVFNDDKKTDLIGDAFVDLTQVIVPGGGQSDKWQELECRKKYAGEIRIELTYYDSRPKLEKPAPRRESIRPVGEDETHLSGPRQYTPVKRRPLPSNPGSAASGDPHRFHAGGPRDYGTPPQLHSGDQTPGSQRQDTFSGRPLPHFDAGLPGDADPYFQQDQLDAQDGYHYGMDNAATGAQDSEMFQADAYIPHTHPSDPANFLPALPPSNRNGHPNDYDGDLRYEPANTYMVSPSEPLDPHQEYPVDASLSHPEMYPSHPETMADPFSPQPVHQHQAAVQLMQLEHRYDVGSDPYVNGHGNEAEMHENFDHNGRLLDDSTFQNEPEEFDVPPPPPVHGGGSSLNRALPNSSPGYSNYERWNPQDNSWHGDDWQAPHPANARGHLTSRSEACLARYASQPETFLPLDVEPPQRRSLNATFQAEDSQHGVHSAPMTSNESVAQRRHSGSSHPSDNYPMEPYNGSPHTPSERSYELVRHSRKNSYQSPNIYESSSYHRKSLSQSQSCPLPNSSPLGSPPHYGTQPQHVHTPTRPHPLSQQHIPSSSPHDHSPSSLMQSQYDPIPIIKPLAISPNKSKASTPGSQAMGARSQGRSPIIHRKSVSPRPPANDGSPYFGTPYSPDDYDVLNPAVAAQKSSKAESIASSSIVDFHGNNIDPSDRLPESTWAPEPTPKLPPGVDPSDHLPASTWAPEPATASSTPTRTGPRKTVVRLRDVPRPLGQRGSTGAAEPRIAAASNSQQRQRHSMYAAPPAPLFSGVAKQGVAGGSPQSVSPQTRNRLVKRNPAAAAMGAAPPYMAAGAGRPASMVGLPPVPAKVPLDSQERSWDGGRGPYGDAPPADMDRLSRELQSIDIGGVGRRINGRRLLGFKDV